MPDKLYTQAEMDAACETARAELAAAHQAGLQGEIDAAVAAGRAEGAQAERARFKAVMTSPEAKGREATAKHLALNTDLGADAIRAVLSGVSKDASTASLPAHGLWMGEEPSAGPRADFGWGEVVAKLNNDAENSRG